MPVAPPDWVAAVAAPGGVGGLGLCVWVAVALALLLDGPPLHDHEFFTC